ncbi:MAG: hypothetical protein UHG68_08790 [Clostridia bacterium]|nr:hypothetical protein [Clostridia bacterium]
MTDHNFTVDDVIKALECFAIDKDFDERQCIGCAFETKGLCCENASEGIAKVALAIIKRQKASLQEVITLNSKLEAENAKLQRLLDFFEKEKTSGNKKAKAEAIKEFAQRLVAIYENDKTYDRPNAHTLVVTVFRNIDNLVKEMTEADDESQNT